MIRSILVPLDGSALAEQALPVAAAAAARLGAVLHLVLVHQPAFVPVSTTGEVLAGELHDVDREAWEQEASYLDGKARQLAAAHGLSVLDALRSGDPAAELARYAEERAIDLVVMTTHGRGGVSRLWLGSVADRLVRQIDQPVLLLRADMPAHTLESLVERVLVPLDGTARAEAALDAVHDLLPAGVGTIHLLNVLKPAVLLAPPPRDTSELRAASLERQRLVAYRYLRRLAGPGRRAGRALATQVATGFGVAQEIVGYAAKHRITLVALATRGRSGLTRLALGSIADKVVRSAQVAVLVCHVADDGAESGMPSEEYRAALEERDPLERPAGGAAWT